MVWGKIEEANGKGDDDDERRFGLVAFLVTGLFDELGAVFGGGDDASGGVGDVLGGLGQCPQVDALRLGFDARGEHELRRRRRNLLRRHRQLLELGRALHHFVGRVPNGRQLQNAISQTRFKKQLGTNSAESIGLPKGSATEEKLRMDNAVKRKDLKKNRLTSTVWRRSRLL